MTTLRVFSLAALVVQSCFAANLAVSTYFKDGFTPTAIASDAQGNVFVAGSAVIDPVAQTTGVAVAKLDPKASKYLYLAYLDSAASDQVSAIAVDSAGNAYVTGWTTNPNFPAVGGGALGTPPAGGNDQRSFVTKLSPDGGVLFSVLIGGSVASRAMGIAVTPQGQILVSGLATASGFLSTKGAYSVTDSNGHWFLMEMDAAATKVIFSATGIGGSSMAFDSGGNIYLAGSSVGTDYPTTPGAYQTTFVQGYTCSFLCQIAFPGGLQHITKVDPTGSTLIYSTGLNDTTDSAGSTNNTGLAVDPAGNAFVTGTLVEAAYPFTVPAPGNIAAYLSKLDPTGSSLLFSVPMGGGGVTLDSSGAVYVGGIVSSYYPNALLTSTTRVTPVAPPAIFSSVPQPCWPDSIVAYNEAYIMKLDPATGNAVDGQWIDGSAPTVVGITLAGGNVWITGATPGSDVPFTPGTISPANLGAGFAAGAYVSAANFSTSAAAGTPAIACVVDAGNLEHVRAVAAFQVIALFGANLGPSTGVPAPDGTDTSVAGVTVMVNGSPAPLLYVSSSQINMEVPLPFPAVGGGLQTPVIQVNVNGASSTERQFPLAASNLNLFANLASIETNCSYAGLFIDGAFQALAMNADGSFNACANPLKLGATVSFFVEGVGSPNGFPPPAELPGLQAFAGECPALVENTSLINGFVYKVDVQFPASLSSCTVSPSNSGEFGFLVTFNYKGAAVGPLFVPPQQSGPIVIGPLPMIVWAKQ